MPRSLKVQKNFIGKVKSAVQQQGFLNQKALAEDLELSVSTVSNFLNGKPVDYCNFLEICQKLELEWKEIGEGSLDIEVTTELEQGLAEVIITPLLDLGEADDVSTFSGRDQELSTLKEWILNEVHFHF